MGNPIKLQLEIKYDSIKLKEPFIFVLEAERMKEINICTNNIPYITDKPTVEVKWQAFIIFFLMTQ